MTLLHRSVAPARNTAPHRAGATDLLREVALVSRLVVGGAVLIALVAPSWLTAHQLWVLGAGFCLGLPHGALDHLLPARHHWVRRGLPCLLGVLVGYVGLAGAAYLGLRLAGGIVLPVLLAVSVLHFGAGDLAAAEIDDPRWPVRAPGRLLAAVGRGGPVLAGPLLAFPAPTGTALAAVGLGQAPSRTTDTVVGVVLLGASIGYVLLALRERRGADAAEVALLVALFLLAPPFAAFGVYFGAWHGLRHTARLLSDDPRNAADLRQGRLAGPLRRLASDAALPSVVALVGVVVLVGLVVGRAELAAPIFAALLALTVPHVVVVGLWDDERRRLLSAFPSRSAGGAA